MTSDDINQIENAILQKSWRNERIAERLVNERNDDMSKDRVEAFSDGVFAFILTLLVLELHVPNIADHSSLGQYVVAMAPLIPKVVSFALTFVIVCIHWVSHHYFFSPSTRGNDWARLVE